MDRSERIRLIQKVASALSQMPEADMGLTLRQFEYETPYRGDYDNSTDYEYAVGLLENGTDEGLIELHHHLYPDESGPAPPADRAVGPWEAGAFPLFLTHTNEHRARAGRLKTSLDRWGVDVFVAHDTIDVSREWEEEIKSALRTCEALCALITPEFLSSRWCDQEVGFAVARSIMILPLKLGPDPHGFISRYQALTVPEATHASTVAGQIFDALARHEKTSAAMTPAIVHRYAKKRKLG